jgi:hypothetical protein
MARAGENLTIEEIAERTHGAAVVEVDLARDRRPGAVRVVRVLGGLPAEVRGAPSWLGLCLPRGKVLRDWTVQHPKWPARARWRQALSRGRYEAVVMLEIVEGGYRPRCGVEAMQMLHTDLSDGYAEYARKVDDVLQRSDADRKR